MIIKGRQTSQPSFNKWRTSGNIQHLQIYNLGELPRSTPKYRATPTKGATTSKLEQKKPQQSLNKPAARKKNRQKTPPSSQFNQNSRRNLNDTSELDHLTPAKEHKPRKPRVWEIKIDTLKFRLLGKENENPKHRPAATSNDYTPAREKQPDGSELPQ